MFVFAGKIKEYDEKEIHTHTHLSKIFQNKKFFFFKYVHIGCDEQNKQKRQQQQQQQLVEVFNLKIIHFKLTIDSSQEVYKQQLRHILHYRKDIKC